MLQRKWCWVGHAGGSFSYYAVEPSVVPSGGARDFCVVWQQPRWRKEINGTQSVVDSSSNKLMSIQSVVFGQFKLLIGYCRGWCYALPNRCHLYWSNLVLQLIKEMKALRPSPSFGAFFSFTCVHFHSFLLWLIFIRMIHLTSNLNTCILKVLQLYPSLTRFI